MPGFNPDDDVYVRSLEQVGAGPDVVERARAAVTEENFVLDPKLRRDRLAAANVLP